MSNRVEFDGLSVAPNVLETIVRIASEQVDGVVAVGGTPITGAASIFKSRGPSVEVSAADEGEALDVAVYITARYGMKLTDLGEEVQKAVLDALGSQLGVEAANIDVYIEGLQFEG
ncbi:MAG: Asp23/Gls24 family envelope stress response protein [Coriobacteriia bacterium]|nr:Asp23/Gls24 family envelope stress response protein [Coriobacteriia bacterium]MCL2871110.1 Asp23/Gls24 family envelope stress response protein [Coriobacteriia bacterium]